MQTFHQPNLQQILTLTLNQGFLHVIIPIRPPKDWHITNQLMHILKPFNTPKSLILNAKELLYAHKNYHNLRHSPLIDLRPMFGPQVSSIIVTLNGEEVKLGYY